MTYRLIITSSNSGNIDLFLHSILLLVGLLLLGFAVQVLGLLLIGSSGLIVFLLLGLVGSGFRRRSDIGFNLGSRLLLLGSGGGIVAGAEFFDEFGDDVHGGVGSAGLSSKDFSRLVDDKDAAGGSLGGLLETDGADEGGAGVTQQGVGKLLLLLEGGVGLGRVGGQAVDG